MKLLVVEANSDRKSAFALERVKNHHPALPGIFPEIQAIRAYYAYQRSAVKNTSVMEHGLLIHALQLVFQQ